MEAVQFEHVSFNYPGRNRKALDDVDFTVHKGQFVVLCGRSGCGKSTLLRHVKKSLVPYGDRSGKIMISGEDIEQINVREAASQVGFVQQNPENQIVTDKVWHELAFGLESLSYGNHVIQKRVAEMASFFGIQTWFRKDTKELSGGQKQLLSLASIMVMQPEIVVLDEPTAQLDPIASKEFLSALIRINQELGTTIMISEHRLEELFPVADTVIVMEEGKIIIQDTPREVGRFLGTGERHQMYHGLPTAMRLYTAVRPVGLCPLTVSEGRLWLEQLFGNNAMSTSNKMHDAAPNYRECILAMEDIWFRYEKHQPDVLKGMHLQVRKGEILGVMGGNAVGKSTVLKIISGWLKPYRGTIKIGNDMVVKNGKNRMNAAMQIGVLPQDPQALFTEITVEEDLYEAVYGQNLSEQEKLSKIEDMLAKMELTELRSENPYDLSGGEQQRLALGKVLLTKPEILLLDEPTKGLDPYFKLFLAEILQNLKNEGMTILLVTHDIEFCAEYADRCAMFFDGICVSCEETKEFFRGNYFYTTTANRIARQLFQDAVTCQEVIDLCKINLGSLNTK